MFLLTTREVATPIVGSLLALGCQTSLLSQPLIPCILPLLVDCFDVPTVYLLDWGPLLHPLARLDGGSLVDLL